MTQQGGATTLQIDMMGTKARMKNDPVLVSLVRRLREALHPELIYLFGSRARGEAGADSDYDFFVVVPQSDKPRHKRDEEAYLVLCGSGVAKDVVVLTRAEFEASRRTAASLTSAVLSEGILLHEA